MKICCSRERVLPGDPQYTGFTPEQNQIGIASRDSVRTLFNCPCALRTWNVFQDDHDNGECAQLDHGSSTDAFAFPGRSSATLGIVRLQVSDVEKVILVTSGAQDAWRPCRSLRVSDRWRTAGRVEDGSIQANVSCVFF